MKKEARQWIEYYWNYVNSDKYKEEKIKRKKNLEQATHDSVEGENIQSEDWADYYEDSIVAHLSICDVLSNDGVTKLLRKLHSLPKKKFKVKNYYRKPSIFHKYDYVHLQYSGSGYEYFAEIELLEDQYIKSIKMIWAQINSYFALIEYYFTFKKRLDEERYHQFIYDNIRNLTSKDYVIWYRISKENDKHKEDRDYAIVEQMTDESFPLICQHYITSFLYSEQGKKNLLINMEYRARKAPIDYISRDLQWPITIKNSTMSFVPILTRKITICLPETTSFHGLAYVSILQTIETNFSIVSSAIGN